MQMADICAAAQITVIAAAGEDPNYGLPRVWEASRDLLQTRKSDSLRLSVCPLLPMTLVLKDSTCISRAWAFQECYFSTRRLFFTDHQIV
ncbi:hypothetical protein BU25DRAFT_412699 [Macroventuria anomochaeta]|uniref:Uncharacterized protein n=1 Tax=Macroventuria anomochaeta TaxID=301207 RepID=A0ACB6RWE4_9PLEO|nr:uncharacterized protein BU25DRAFT_412699 [Macroventuria anomochaeta]KAF2625254.1 hypothetical protein BU25DRAFT_412699 [Macroventuria anomochaeta]